MAGEPRKPMKRPGRREALAAERLRRSKITSRELVSTYSPIEVNRHATIVESSLKLEKINWTKIDPSIKFIKRFVADSTVSHRKIAKAWRSLERKGETFPKQLHESLRKAFLEMQRFEHLIEAIEARREEES